MNGRVCVFYEFYECNTWSREERSESTDEYVLPFFPVVSNVASDFVILC